MKKFVICIIFSLSFSACIMSDGNTIICGTIHDIDENPIYGAKIVLKVCKNKNSGTSNELGEFSITSDTYGEYCDHKATYSISKDGYITQSGEFNESYKELTIILEEDI